MYRENSRTETYSMMYDAPVNVIIHKLENHEDAVEDFPERQRDATYWIDGEIAVTIERTHKLALGKPTVTIAIPIDKLGIENCTPAAADYCLRELKPHIDTLNAPLYNRGRPDSEKGKYYTYEPGGAVLVRNSAYFESRLPMDYEYGVQNYVHYYPYKDAPARQMYLCLKIQIQLPFHNLDKASDMLLKHLPRALEAYLAHFDIWKLYAAQELEAKQNAIREQLNSSDYCAFIANGAILPRSKGTDLPMLNAIPFKSTETDEIELCGVRGMGIKRGVTVITGGGYSGKSTLLDAVSAGIYNHISGDGRELCVTDGSAVTISAEDGRSVKNVNISPFIKWLPGGDTVNFSTDHASGSTSQAANIMEAVDCGSKLLLIDEDKSATNFMIRDALMKELIEKEPITPFTDRVKELHGTLGVSTILVIGGSGEYLSVADKVYMMEDFVIHDVTNKAQRLASDSGVTAHRDAAEGYWLQRRTLLASGFLPFPEDSNTEKLEISDMGFIFIGRERIDVRGLHNILSQAQLNALGFMLRKLELSITEKTVDLDAVICALYDAIAGDGLDSVHTAFFTACERFLDLPRKQELFAVISRMRRTSWDI
jgi:predicted ABC-class ATPase